MKNEEVFKKTASSPNTVIHSIYHLGSQFRSFPLSDFLYDQLDIIDFESIFPKIKSCKIVKALEEKKLMPLIIDSGYCGWVAEVSFPHILDKDMNTSEDEEHCAVFYSEDFIGLIDNIMKQSKAFIKSDLAKGKAKNLKKVL